MAEAMDTNEGSYQEVIPEYMNLHSSLPTQAGVIKKVYRNVPPTHSIESTGPISFEIPSGANELIYPNGIRIRLQLQVRDAAGNPIQRFEPKDPDAPAGDKKVRNEAKVFPVNGFAHAIFSDIEVWINDTKIASYDSKYAYKADLECRLFSTASNKKHSLLMCGYKDEMHPYEKVATDLAHLEQHTGAAELEDEKIHEKGKIKKTSIIFNRRLMKCRGSKTMYYEDRIYSEIFNQSKCLPPGSKLSIKFERSRPTFSLLAVEGGPYTIFFEKCYLSVPILKGNPDFIKEMEHKTYSGENMRFPLRRMVCNSFLFGGFARTFTIDNILGGTVTPRRIFVGFINAPALAGDYKLDPFNYQHFGVQEIKCLLGGQLSSVPELKCDYDVIDGELDALSALLKTLGSEDTTEEVGIDLDNFRNRNNIYAFDINGLSGVEMANAFTREEKLPTGLDITFKGPVGDPICVVVYKEYDSEIVISGGGEINLLPYA